MRIWVIVIAALGCGNDEATSIDAPPIGVPIVAVSSPRANDSIYASENLVVVWTATVADDDLLDCTVSATDGAVSFPIAEKLVPSGGGSSAALWMLAGVPLSNSYQVRVSCVTDAGATGVGMSGVFAVTGPPQAVSYATQIQPLWTGCSTQMCHDATQPQEDLNLSAAVSYANTVGVPSTQCPTTLLVNPGNPGDSYMLIKLQGSGPCMKGGRMPKTSPAFTQPQLQLVRDWIANGAPNN